ncbi:hypothetical protein EVG20_g4426 [Dentipellis fragilis]|uniref:RAM signaling network component n=1 Tax=Dentipellis fragilis TaxID=205917 RepID=A0A4Y9YYL4_9AGAM|nr:hypothetical protein EVG20_g4426 [Dentipellis fragilis]
MAVSEVDFAVGRVSPGLFQHKRRPSSPPVASTSLNHIHIAEALLRSEDNGATLDLSHKGITDVGEYGAEELAAIGREDLMEDESSVLRITLASNRLATLPMAFALLSRLRYLNLKSNSFSVFPDVLTIMPSLEVLDIGRNKLKRLPSQPGSLINLRVFSIYKNRITKLPPYLAQFKKLNILRIEANPLEWPPKSVTDGQEPSKDWVKGLQRWIEDNSSASEHRKLSDDSLFKEPIEDVAPSDNISDAAPSFFQQSTRVNGWATDSDISVISDSESSRMPAPSPRTDRPPPLYLGSLPPANSDRASSRSPESYLPTPEGSASPDGDSSNFGDGPVHARNASYAGSTRGHSRGSLTGKKSLPDLRPAKLRLGAELGRTDVPDMPYGNHQAAFASALKANKSADNFSIPSPLSQRQDSSESSDGFPFAYRTARPIPPPSRMTSSPTQFDQPAPPMDVERNSYFRRFSTLASSAVANTIPEPLLILVDAIRGILFAVSQVYQSLRHYTVYAIDERLSSVLSKVLDPASAYMAQLISALDRFDSMSRRTIPTPSVCRAVVQSCKDNVAAFGKAVGVLSLQLKVLALHDDVRYTRQMLLTLYSASAEISHAWNSMASHLNAVEPFLRDLRPPPATKSRKPSMHSPLVGSFDAPPASAPAMAAAFPPAFPPESPTTWRTHMASSLPSSVDIPQFQAGVATGTDTPTPRAALRQAGYFNALSSASISIPSPSRLPSKSIAYASSMHSRQGSQSSLTGSSTSASPSMNGRLPVFDAPADLSTLVDKEALDAMTKAVEAAPSVWDMVDTVLTDMPERKQEISETLDTAQAVTAQLKESITALQDGVQVDRKALHDDAHLFVKTVVQLSNAIRSHGGSHPLSSVIRTHMVKLTNATEEFVILLHVSSFSRAPRPYSPMTVVNGSSQPSVSHSTDDSRLGPSLSRSLSHGTEALPTMPFGSPPSRDRDAPHSALPNQSFSIPTPPRRIKKDPADDTLDA